MQGCLSSQVPVHLWELAGTMSEQGTPELTQAFVTSEYQSVVYSLCIFFFDDQYLLHLLATQ